MAAPTAEPHHRRLGDRRVQHPVRPLRPSGPGSARRRCRRPRRRRPGTPPGPRPARRAAPARMTRDTDDRAAVAGAAAGARRGRRRVPGAGLRIHVVEQAAPAPALATAGQTPRRPRPSPRPAGPASSISSAAAPSSASRLRASTSGSAAARRGELGLLPVSLLVPLVVPAHPQRGRLHQERAARRRGPRPAPRPAPAAVASTSLPGSCAERHAVAGGPPGDGHRVLVGRPGELREPVVLAQEDHRQPPQGRQVERLVERAGGDRAVAEERDHDAARPRGAERVRGADRDRQPRADDAVRAEDAERRVGDVHRPAPAAAGPGLLAHQLGEHPARLESLGQHVAVAAVRRRDHVVGPGVKQGADRARPPGRSRCARTRVPAPPGTAPRSAPPSRIRPSARRRRAVARGP